MPRVLHRMRQFFGAVRPSLGAGRRDAAYAWLTPAERALFDSMTLRDQEHGVIVFERVRRQAGDDPALLTAALLHDCGKGDVALWHRVLYVLLRAAAPGQLRRLATHAPGWRGAVWRLAHHPELGADAATRAGSAADVVRMIREQDAPRPDVRLAILQAADDA